MEAVEMEEGVPGTEMIKVPQLIERDGRLVCSQERHEEAIRNHLTVIVSRKVAIEMGIPFVCHTPDEYTPNNPYDKTRNPIPFTSLLDEDEIRGYYNTVNDREEVVDRASLSEETLQQYEELNELDRELSLNGISENEHKRRTRREEDLCTKEKVQVACRVNKVDIRYMSTDDIYRYLSHNIRNNAKNNRDIAHLLAQLNQPIQEATDLLIKMVFCGTTGVGKTELIRHIAILCGIDTRESDKRHIRIDFSTCRDRGHANIIMGPGPGYAGYGEPCLVDYLHDALAYINEQEKETAVAMEQLDAVSPLEAMHRRRHEKPRPKVILLEINEMDKGNVSLFTALNQFLDKGCLSSHRGRRFVLPPDVFIVMCACSNFANTYFVSLPVEPGTVYSRRDAQIQIRASMKTKGLKDCDIVRLGIPYPFFPINRNDACEIMRFKLREHIAHKGLYVDHINMCLSMSELSQELFIDYLIAHMYVETEGIRPMVERMKRELTYVMTTHREYLEHHINTTVCPVPLTKRPILLFQSIDRETRPSMGSLARHPVLGNRDRSHILNEYNLEDCVQCQTGIGFFVLSLENVLAGNTGVGRPPLPSIHVLSAMTRASPISVSKRKAVEEIPKEASTKPDKIARVDDKLSDSEEEPEEEIEEQNDIVEEEEEEESGIMEESSVTVTREHKKGRPRKIPEGFEYYDTHNKRSRFRCTNPECRLVVASMKSAVKHKCKKRL